MKKLLALLPIAALVLTGCGGVTSTHPATVPTAEPTSSAPAPEPVHQSRYLVDVGSNEMFEVTGTNSNGMRYRCYVTDGPSSISQTCFEYGPAS